MRRTAILVVVALLVLGAAGVAALRYASQRLESQIEAALGPDSQVGSIAVASGSVVVRDIKVRAPKGWPTPETLRADSIVLKPDLRALLSGDVRVASIIAERVYLAALRTREGKLVILPSILGDGSAADDATDEETRTKPGPAVTIDSTELRDGVLEIYDAQVRRTPYLVRIEGVAASVGTIAMPELTEKTKLDIAGKLKGTHRDGTISIQGDIRLSDLDSKISTVLRGVDLVALEPYLVQASESGVKRGTLDLEIESTVEKRHLSAPGTMTLSGLELSGSTFMGMPRQAVLAALEDHSSAITVRFNLSGSLDDPSFSIHQSFAMRVGTAVAEGLGLSVRGLARGLGGAAQTLTDKLGDVFDR